MTDIKSFLGEASSTLGISENQAGDAVGGLLGLIKGKISSEDAGELMDALPGADSLVKAASAESGGGMGGLMSAASGLLGGKAGGALGVMGVLKSADLDMSTAGQLVQMLFTSVSENKGGGLVSRILEQVPDLKGLLD